jgi:hypothetical protein
MAIRNAYSLGMHRKETSSVLQLNDTDTKVRRNLWESLFILDRILSASLGRPMAIPEDSSPGNVLTTDFLKDLEGSTSCPPVDPFQASVRSCHTIGLVLDNLSSLGSIEELSSEVTESIAKKCQQWPLVLDENVRAMYESPDRISPSHDPMGSLHANLLHCKYPTAVATS